METGEVFASLAEAAGACGLKSSALIRKCVDDPGKTSGGFHWRRADKREDEDG